ncbi:hypothetical protein [Pseudomonas sp. KNUC1026]|uniref:hypothetical protein n=1 Tax=Pseudomonas sp. KNUC1026 TaxID=2893890 RepID=UPI001F41DBDF|nr:hypothetical protein [Pseudomonas sp. KNUC1026]UFH48974.1 hypothetical protein LN139_18715 [Pseudomonas sp. KNUC1026]
MAASLRGEDGTFTMCHDRDTTMKEFGKSLRFHSNSQRVEDFTTFHGGMKNPGAGAGVRCSARFNQNGNDYQKLKKTQ